MSQDKKIAVISGGSKGIGRALAEIMARKGYKVLATTRKLTSVASLAAVEGIEYLEMDVRDDMSVKDVMARVEAEQGRIDVMVNNAGLSGSGPIEEADCDVLRDQFETNFFGVLRCMRAVLPGMRDRRSGTIVNIGSVGGVIALPFQGYYSATKFALEAITESSWHELKPFGIRVILIQPTDVMTSIWKDGPHSEIEKSAYEDGLTRFHEVKKKEMEVQAAPAEKVASQILSAIESRGTRLRFGVGKNAELFKMARRLLPESLMLFAVGRNYGQ